MWYDNVCVCLFVCFFFFCFFGVGACCCEYYSFSCFRSFVLHLYHTNITRHIFENAGVASLRKLVHHSGVGYMFALPQQQQSKKMCHLIFSVEKIANVTCMLDDNLIGYYTFWSTSNSLFLTKILNTASFCELQSPYSLMQGCTPEWRTNFQREATTRDSKRDQSRNTVIRDPRILCTPPPPFKISGSAPGMSVKHQHKNNNNNNNNNK